jgi:hypothetical protein
LTCLIVSSPTVIVVGKRFSSQRRRRIRSGFEKRLQSSCHNQSDFASGNQLTNRLAAKEAAAYGEADSVSFKPSKVRFNFRDLTRFIQSKFPNAVVNNQKYPWTDSVVLNGARLAKLILGNPDAIGRPLVLVGHSMGGLVCRVANLFLRQPNLVAVHRNIFLNYYNQKQTDLVSLLGLALGNHNARTVDLVATIGTPNSGAMLKAQLSAMGDLLGKALAVKFNSLDDLNTARLFRLFQYFSTDTPLLSISGSGWNRLGKGNNGSNFLGASFSGTPSLTKRHDCRRPFS